MRGRRIISSSWSQPNKTFECFSLRISLPELILLVVAFEVVNRISDLVVIDYSNGREKNLFLLLKLRLCGED